MYIILVITVSLASALIALLIYRKDKTKRVNQLFAFIAVLVCMSTVSYPLVNINFEDQNIGLIVNRLQFVVIFWLAPSLYLFTRYFPIEVSEIKKGEVLLLLGSKIFLDILFIFTPLGIVDVINLGETTDIERGPIYYIFLFYTISIVLYSLIHLGSKINRVSAADRTKVRYVLLGFLVLLLFILGISVVAPLITGTTEVSNYGFVSFVPWLVIIAYTIIRHRLFDIRFIFGTITYYLIVSVPPYLTFFFLVAFYERYLGGVFTGNSYLFGTFVAIIFVMFSNKFNKYLRQEVSVRIINPGYDPYEVVDSLGKELSMKINLEDITSASLKILKRTMRAEFESIVILDKEEKVSLKNLELQDNKGMRDFEDFNKIVYLWKNYKVEPLVIDELKHQFKPDSKGISEWIRPVIEGMVRNKFGIVSPLFIENKIIGMVVMGYREGSGYSSQDIDLLANICNTLSLAIERSLFFEEIKEFNSTLQTKVNAATESLRNQNSSLENALYTLQKVRQKEQDMMDIMGHELRTPITIVRNAISLLQADLTPDKYIETEKLGTYLDRIMKGTKREMVLIETLLASTKIDANRMQLRLEKLDLFDLFADALLAHRDQATSRKLVLEIDPNTPLKDKEVFIYADKVRAQEVIDNLVSNAVKYTNSGSVQISYSKTTHPKKPTPMIRVTVTDTGMGIPAEDLKRLGSKFFRARQVAIGDNLSSAKPGNVAGTGIGLYVSFELVKIMGGEVEVKSEVGKGSSFSFTIPEFAGQEEKTVDQTFNDDEEFERRLREKLEKDKDLLGISDEMIARLKANDKEADRRRGNNLQNANELIDKIRAGRQYLEREDL